MRHPPLPSSPPPPPPPPAQSHSLNAPSILRATQSAHTSPARKPTSPSSARKRAASKPAAKRVTSHDPPPSSSSSSYAEHRPSLFRKLFPRRRSGKSSPSHSKQSHYINVSHSSRLFHSSTTRSFHFSAKLVVPVAAVRLRVA